MSTFESCSNQFFPDIWKVLLLSPEEVDALSGTANLSLAHVTLCLVCSPSCDLSIQVVYKV